MLYFVCMCIAFLSFVCCMFVFSSFIGRNKRTNQSVMTFCNEESPKGSHQGSAKGTKIATIYATIVLAYLE